LSFLLTRLTESNAKRDRRLLRDGAMGRVNVVVLASPQGHDMRPQGAWQTRKGGGASPK
jgi:hypothetical protein